MRVPEVTQTETSLGSGSQVREGTLPGHLLLLSTQKAGPWREAGSPPTLPGVPGASGTAPHWLPLQGAMEEHRQCQDLQPHGTCWRGPVLALASPSSKRKERRAGELFWLQQEPHRRSLGKRWLSERTKKYEEGKDPRSWSPGSCQRTLPSGSRVSASGIPTENLIGPCLGQVSNLDQSLWRGRGHNTERVRPIPDKRGSVGGAVTDGWLPILQVGG